MSAKRQKRTPGLCVTRSISARWLLSIVSLRSVGIGVAKRAPEKASTAPLRLGIVASTAPLTLGVVAVGLVPVPWFRRLRDLIRAARGNAGQYNLGIFQANFRNQRIKRCGIFTRDTHAAMRSGLAEKLRLIGAMDGVTILPEKNRMRHGSVV